MYTVGVSMCVYWEHILRLAHGWTWGHGAHPSSIGLPNAVISSAAVGSAPHTALQQECLRLGGINYEPEVTADSS